MDQLLVNAIVGLFSLLLGYFLGVAITVKRAEGILRMAEASQREFAQQTMLLVAELRDEIDKLGGGKPSK